MPDDKSYRDALSELDERVSKLLDDFRQMTAVDWNSSANSTMAAESLMLAREVGPQGQWSGGDARLSGNVSFLLLQASAQYLEGIQGLLRHDSVAFALSPVVRSMFEAMGTAAWVIDPGNDTIRQRSARFRVLWLDDLKQAVVVRKAVGQKDERKSFERSRNQFKVEIRGLFNPDEIIEGTAEVPFWNICEQSLPGLRDSVRQVETVFRKAWGAARFYDVLSALSHPTVSVLTDLIDKSPGVQGFRFSLPNAVFPTTRVDNAASLFVNTWTLVAAYHGLPTNEIEKLSAPFHQSTS